jgi:hypothetical protein
MTIKHKFNLLRFYASAQQLFGVILVIIAIVLFLGGLSSSSIFGVSFIFLSIGLFVSGIILISLGDLCYVLISIEENTRLTTELLENYIQSMKQPILSSVDDQSMIYQSKCIKCGNYFPRGKLKCPNCGEWAISQRGKAASIILIVVSILLFICFILKQSGYIK